MYSMGLSAGGKFWRGFKQAESLSEEVKSFSLSKTDGFQSLIEKANGILRV